MYSSALLNKRVTILTPYESGRRTLWMHGATVWCNLSWTKGKRALNQGDVNVYDYVMFRMRFTEGIDSHSRLLCDGKYYVIESFHADRGACEIQATAKEVEPFAIVDPTSGSGSGSGNGQ